MARIRHLDPFAITRRKPLLAEWAYVARSKIGNRSGIRNGWWLCGFDLWRRCPAGLGRLVLVSEAVPTILKPVRILLKSSDAFRANHCPESVGERRTGPARVINKQPQRKNQQHDRAEQNRQGPPNMSPASEQSSNQRRASVACDAAKAPIRGTERRGMASRSVFFWNIGPRSSSPRRAPKLSVSHHGHEEHGNFHRPGVISLRVAMPATPVR